MRTSKYLSTLLRIYFIFIVGQFLLFYILTPSTVFADSEIKESIPHSSESETVIVTATRVPTTTDRVAENTVVLTSEEIEHLPARDLGEVLSYVPGVDVQVTSLFGQSTSLSIHGSNSRHVLLMVDGIPFNTQLSGQANPSRIPIEHIERIEVIKGASSSAWGSSLGGVVNVITKPVGDSEIPKGSFTSTFAEFTTTKNSLDLAGKIADVGYLLTGSYLNSDGPLGATDVEETKTFTKLSYDLSDQAKLTGSFGYSGANVLYGPTRTNRINSQPYISRYGKMLFELEKDEYNVNVAYKYNDQDVTTDIFNATTGAQVSSTVSHNVYQGMSLNSHVYLREEDLLLMGVDLDWHLLKSNNFLTDSKDIDMQAPYVNYSMKWDNWNVIPGVRYDRNEQFGSQTSPSLGAIYHFDGEHRSLVRAKISRAFNAPPLLWIFNDDASQFVGPNLDLEAERSMVYEIGLETNLMSPLDIKLDLYRADVKDAIALVFEGGVFVQKNFRKFRRQGVELLLNYEVNDDLNFYGSGAFNDVENRATRKTVRDQGVPRQSFKLGANYKNEKGYGVYLTGYYNRWTSSPSLQPNDRKFIFDAKLLREFKDIKKDIDMDIFLNIHNLTNSKYWSSITFPHPKRYFEGGFSLKF